MTSPLRASGTTLLAALLIAPAFATGAVADDDPPPPPAPAVVTGDVAGFDVGNATVTGTINPNGADTTTCKVEYGPTTEYDESKLCDSSPGGGGTAPVAVQALLTGLLPRQTIHYRFVATSDGGTTMGEDRTLVTTDVVGSQAPTEGGSDGGSSGGSGGSGGGSGGGATAPARLTLPGTARATAAGRVTLRLSCGPAAPCRGTLKLTARSGGRTFTAGTLRVALQAGRRATASVRLTAAARRQLRRRHRLALTARGAGASKTITLRG